MFEFIQYYRSRYLFESGIIDHWRKMLYINNGSHEIFSYARKSRQTNQNIYDLGLNVDKIKNVFYFLTCTLLIAFISCIIEYLLIVTKYF